MCMFRGCTENDLLPVKCGKCWKLFCTRHMPYAAHECQAHRDNVVPTCPICQRPIPLLPGQSPDVAVSRHIDSGCTSASPAATRHNFCSFPSCSRNEIVLILCEKCGQSYCVNHRAPQQHQCARLSPAPEPVKPARGPIFAGATVTPSFSSAKAATSSPQQKSPQASPVAASSTPALASPARSVAPLASRKTDNVAGNAVGLEKIRDPVVVKVFPPEDTRRNPVFMAFPRRAIAGRCLDSACSYWDLPNVNNAAVDEKDRFQLTLLRTLMLVPASMALEDLGIEMNDSIMLHKGPVPPTHVVAEVEALQKNPTSQAAIAARGKGPDGRPKKDCAAS